MPMSWATRLRAVFWRSTGLRRRLLRLSVDTVFRHWPLGRLGEFHLPDNSAVRIAASDSLLVRRLFWFGESGYEAQEASYWRQACCRASRIVEMGANIGYYTVQGALANPTSAYVAVEPQESAVKVLLRNLELNNIRNVEVMRAAVIDVGPTDMRLHFPVEESYETPTGAYLDGAESISRRSVRSESVPTVRAAELVGGADLLKLDIEGYEARVLLAAESVVAKERPVIFVEMRGSADSLRRLVDRWRSEYGYQATAVGDRDLVLHN